MFTIQPIPLFVATPDPHCHQPVPVVEGEGHSIGAADAACGEEIPRRYRSQCTVPGACQLHLQVGSVSWRYDPCHGGMIRVMAV